jgi:hypothetical protein
MIKDVNVTKLVLGKLLAQPPKSDALPACFVFR